MNSCATRRFNHTTVNFYKNNFQDLFWCVLFETLDYHDREWLRHLTQDDNGYVLPPRKENLTMPHAE